MNDPKVLVMMATYNGEKYVAEQIDSILAQENVDVTLLISDDGSTDSTVAICDSYSNRYPNVLFKVNSNNKGLSKNFMDMVYQTDSESFDYFAFSDQDDYWMPCKLNKAIEKILSTREGPRLYYSDVLNTNENLDGGAGEYRPFVPYANSFGLLLTINWASGCTMVFNSAFCNKLKQYEPKTWPRIHDGWVHLVALGCGWAVPDLERSFIKRRISANNQVGERNLGSASLSRLLKALKAFFLKRNHDYLNIAQELDKGFKDCLTDNNSELLCQFIASRDNVLKRIEIAFSKSYVGPYSYENLMHVAKAILGVY